MNNKLLLIGGLLVAGAIGAFLLLKPGGPGALLPGGRETVSSSFADLLKMGKDYTCTFTTVDEAGASTNGTIYVADQGTKLNGDFTMTAANGTVTDSNILSDGTYTYIWSSDQAQGIKMKVDPEDDSLWGTDDETVQGQQEFDENKPVDFSCEPWRPQASMFVPPTDIEFTDFSAQLEMMQQQLEDVPAAPAGTGNGQYCAACDQLQGDSKAQCLTAMGC